MHDVAVIDDPAAAEESLDPIRAHLLAERAAPESPARRGGRSRGLAAKSRGGAPRGGRAPRFVVAFPPPTTKNKEPQSGAANSRPPGGPPAPLPGATSGPRSPPIPRRGCFR